MSLLYGVSNILLFTATAEITLFVIGYGLFARWETTEAGKFIMVMMSLFMLALGYQSWRTITAVPVQLPGHVLAVKVAIFACISIVFGWNLSMLYRRQISSRRVERERIRNARRKRNARSRGRHTS